MALSIPEYIEKLSGMAIDLSLKYAEKLMEEKKDDAKDDEEDKRESEMESELSRLNEIKKNLNFAKKLYKEMNPQKAAVKSGGLSSDFFNKIKQLESSVGDIVRSMPKN
jgi:CRISPR/Cas system-associated protein Csm6